MGAQELFWPKSTQQSLASLRAQLANFGLNPLEWMIFARRENSYQFAHREDPTFQINATVRSLRTGLLRLDRLSVISL